MRYIYTLKDKKGNVVLKTNNPYEARCATKEGITVIEDNRFYPQLYDHIKAQAFDVMDYFNVNRKSFSGMHFTQAFKKLYDECREFLDISTGSDDEIDELARAVNTTLTLEQHRMHSYTPGEYYKF